MAINFLNNLGDRFKNLLSGDIINKFNKAFFSFVGARVTSYDPNGKTYIDKGYNLNSVVYSVIQQMSVKSASVPYYITDDKNIKTGILRQLEIKASNSNKNYKEMPLKSPNPNQNWTEFLTLYKTFLRTTGNVYIYVVSPSEGNNAGVPLAMYLLPSHQMNIVLKNNANLLIDEDPIDYYTLIDGSVYADFKGKDVIHIAFANPNFDRNGQHLYGQSPLRAALQNIQSSNVATEQNIHTLNNAGAYGFIHGKGTALTKDQADELKGRLLEMDASPERLGRIAGASSEIGFTRLSLTTDELKPFEFLKYAQKEICNCLGWSDKLLNNDDGAKYDNIKEIRKQLVADNIHPDLMLLEDAFNNYILPRFKGYENSKIVFDVDALPEMQADIKQLVEWLSIALNDGIVTRNEYREYLGWERISNSEMDAITVGLGVTTLEDAMLGTMDIDITDDAEAI
jgi:HK97 family phage portal protein